MITADGYSKDPCIVPEGIAVTFAKSMIDNQGGLKQFLYGFQETMNDLNAYWLHKCKNRPQHDILYVYVIVANRLYCRVQYGQYYKDQPVDAYTMDGREIKTTWSYIILAGPMIKCPFKRKLSGFRGFRYTTKLF